MSLFWFVYILLCLSLVLEVGVIRLAITVALTGAIIVWFVWAITYKSYKDQKWYCKMCTIFGWIIVLIGCSIIPVYNAHQEDVKKEVVETTEFSNVTRVTYVKYIPEQTSRMWTGKFFMYRTAESQVIVEEIYQCYSEKGELINTFDSEDMEVDFGENQISYLETKYKDLWKVNHIQDLLNVKNEIDFIEGECVKEHESHSYCRVEVQKKLYINPDTLETKTIYVNE